MTKKDYELIARVVRNYGLSHPNSEKVVSHLSSEFADELQKENPRFVRHKFIDACLRD